MQWTQLVSVALGGVLAILGGVIAELLRWVRDPRQRRHERGEQAALRLQELLVRLSLDLARIDSTLSSSHGADAMDDFIRTEFSPIQSELMVSASHVTDARLRTELAFVVYGIGWSPGIAHKLVTEGGNNVRSASVGRQLAEYGRWVMGTYLRGDSWNRVPRIEALHQAFQALTDEHEMKTDL